MKTRINQKAERLGYIIIAHPTTPPRFAIGDAQTRKIFAWGFTLDEIRDFLSKKISAAHEC